MKSSNGFKSVPPAAVRFLVHQQGRLETRNQFFLISGFPG